jgi:large subunit ribosomal protein L9
MAKNVELLLVENVENTGIVGDVVKVRKGFARNYLLPRKLATTPSAELVKQLAGKRADAERMLAEQRKEREALIQRLAGFELSMIRSCNDQGILYGAVTQHEIAMALDAAGFKGIKDREVRIGGSIKRVDSDHGEVQLGTADGNPAEDPGGPPAGDQEERRVVG